ncbi:hypothetical protein [Deinococcus sp. Leaf326]|uniref:hypothetical protein n=1 Tax=Deinococcus sp. Leaf326 TaxID=1736338 RepID=UPI0006FB77A0|nr:hypothetical protein [Deinococcus sp. Leaf326]KQR40805.1 hypothetical protein ASF71_01160 [Deinococcus sp. Leaf326]
MSSRLPLALLAPLALAGAPVAHAATLDFSASYPLGARAGVSDLRLLGGAVGAGLSTRGADLSYARGLALPPLGAASAELRAALAWSGGVRLGATATGTAGPVALNLGLAGWTTAATTLDPLAAWTLAPADLHARGLSADLGARYRLSRALVATADGHLGAQPQLVLGVENRRDLTRTLPPTEGDDPAAPPETETTGTLTLRGGVRTGQEVLGLTAGVAYATPAGTVLALDAQAGPARGGRRGLGLVASVTAPDLLGEGSRVQAYAAYEPWRLTAAPLRLGAQASLPLGPGTATLDLSGGRDPAGVAGFGVRVGYQFPLGGSGE